MSMEEYKGMARSLPKEVREAIVNACKSGMGTIVEIAEMFNVTTRTISNYLRIDRESGDLTPRPKTGRPAILNSKNLAVIKSIIMSKADGTLQEYCDAFKKVTKIEVTYVTMHNACKKLKIRRKKRVITRKKEIG